MSETEETVADEFETERVLKDREAARLRKLDAAVTILRLGLEPALAGEEGAEERLTPEAKTAMEGFVDWVTEDLERARTIAKDIPDLAKDGCQLCRARGYVKRIARVTNKVSYEICSCVVRSAERRAIRAQSISNSQTVPGRSESRIVDEERLTEAAAVLERAKTAQAVACATLDLKILGVEEGLAGYTAERARLVTKHAAAVEQATLCGAAQMTAHDQVEYHRERAEALALQHGTAVQAQLELRGYPSEFGERDLERQLFLKESESLLHQIRHFLGQRDWWTGWRDSFGIYRREADATIGALEYDITRLDDANADAVADFARLKKERARIAGHHAPKIERAERRLSRLAYLKGDAS